MTEAARNFADCINRAHYQNVTFVLVKNGQTVASLGPGKEKLCTGRDLAETLAEIQLPDEEGRTWVRDLRRGRKTLKVPTDKWR